MSEIILGGVKLNEVKALKQAMQKDAVAFVSNGIEQGTALINQALESFEEFDDEALITTLLKQAEELFDNVSLVAGVTGVSYRMPYYEEYGHYDSDEVLSHMLENSSIDWDLTRALCSTLGSMEEQCKSWYSSTC